MEDMHSNALLFSEFMELPIEPTFLSAYVTVKDIVEKHKFFAQQDAQQDAQEEDGEEEEARGRERRRKNLNRNRVSVNLSASWLSEQPGTPSKTAAP